LHLSRKKIAGRLFWAKIFPYEPKIWDPLEKTHIGKYKLHPSKKTFHNLVQNSHLPNMCLSEGTKDLS